MNTRHPGRPKKVGPWPKCKIVECDSSTEGGSKGFCHKHYIYARRGIFDMETGKRLRSFERVSSYGEGHICSAPNCGRKARANGLCHAHWQRQKNGLSLETPIKEKALGPFVQCFIPGCKNRAASRGMCLNHSERRRRGFIDEAGNKLRDRFPIGRPRTDRHYLDGYVLVWAPEDHPHAQSSGLILEHRLAMERHLERYLEEWEIVHHKDGNRSNNTIENLELLDGRAKRKAGAGHPPAHEFDTAAAKQVLLQQPDLPEALRQQLEAWRRKP